MNHSAARVAILIWALTSPVLVARDAAAQFRTAATGRFYSLELSVTVDALFDELYVERVAPAHLAAPAPIGPISLPVRLRQLTSQILELPEHQRLFFTAIDGGGAVRLLELDLIGRHAREVLPPPGLGRPYRLHLSTPADGSKLYVQWFAPGALAETDIYDGITLGWLGRTAEFRPDTRAVGFLHRPPYVWTLDEANRLILIDSHSDRIVRILDPEQWFGPGRGEISDAWRDLILVRLDAGRDRYHVVDVVSGEVGPALDLSDYRRAEPRLVGDGRFLVLVNAEPRPPSRYRWLETAVATGSGEVYDLRIGEKVDEFQLPVGPELPVTSVATETDPSVPGRLWVFAPGSHERFDIEVPTCGRKAPQADHVVGTIDVLLDPDEDPPRYQYVVGVGPFSEPAGAIAIRTDGGAERILAPSGWGAERLKGDRWVRWTNGLGPSFEDIGPGQRLTGFEIVAGPNTRPGIAEYRIQASTGLPRGCESDDHFLKNSAVGQTIAPEEVRTSNPRKLAERLEKIAALACDVRWIDEADCKRLRQAAAETVREKSRRGDAVRRFQQVLAGVTAEPVVALTLRDAASAVQDALSP